MKESFESNIRKIITGGAIIGAGLIPKESDAQSGLFGKVKDIIKDKIEVVSNSVKERANKENKEYPQKQQENKKDSIIYNSGGDKVGFKYPFEKEYKSDEKFYRTVAYGKMRGTGCGSQELEFLSEQDAKKSAIINILKTEMSLEGGLKIYQKNYGPIQIRCGDKKIYFGNVKTIDKATFKNTQTGVYTTVIAVEVARDKIKIETDIKAEIETKNKNDLSDSRVEKESTVKNLEDQNKVLNKEPHYSIDQKNQEIKNPTEIKEKENSIYYTKPEDFKKASQTEFENYKTQNQGEFDSFKKRGISDLESFKKVQEEEFNKFKKGGKSESLLKTDEPTINWPDSTRWKEYKVEEPDPIPIKGQASGSKKYKDEEPASVLTKNEVTQ